MQRLLPETVEIDIVSDSGHLIYTDNYKELAEKMLNYINKNSNESKVPIEINQSQTNNIEISSDISTTNNDLKNKIELENIESKNV